MKRKSVETALVLGLIYWILYRENQATNKTREVTNCPYLLILLNDLSFA